ncbi:hypothetical protein PoB_006387000 [Plakobranchus ocellatus]|uniref:Uncharacterized protein n=1 Tax=Plakobranchus ocellatus TaxID=259542 RepID=A0AAV4D000_9GAST|nr:hypothetical protein PoB_006387000 [Plakobranchus ocellatus]
MSPSREHPSNPHLSHTFQPPSHEYPSFAPAPPKCSPAFVKGFQPSVKMAASTSQSVLMDIKIQTKSTGFSGLLFEDIVLLVFVLIGRTSD